MGFKWTDAAQKSQEMVSRDLPPGKHQVKIAKLIYENRDGEPFTSQFNHCEQVMVIFEDVGGRSAFKFFDLSDEVEEGGRPVSAMWINLLAWMEPPVNFEAMEADGVQVSHFADPEFAAGVLIKKQRRLWINVTANKSGKTTVKLIPPDGPLLSADKPSAEATTTKPEAAPKAGTSGTSGGGAELGGKQAKARFLEEMVKWRGRAITEEELECIRAAKTAHLNTHQKDESDLMWSDWAEIMKDAQARILDDELPF